MRKDLKNMSHPITTRKIQSTHCQIPIKIQIKMEIKVCQQAKVILLALEMIK